MSLDVKKIDNINKSRLDFEKPWEIVVLDKPSDDLVILRSHFDKPKKKVTISDNVDVKLLHSNEIQQAKSRLKPPTQFPTVDKSL